MALIALALAGCGRGNQEPRAEWRAQAERECLRSGAVRLSHSIRQMPPINPGGHCGADHPLKVEAFDRVGVRVQRGVPMTCPMVAATERWLHETVQPAAMAHFRSRVVEVETYGTYNCRRVMNRSSGPMSEHAFVNAIDVAGFTLEDGRRVRVGRRSTQGNGLPSPWRFDERSIGAARNSFDLFSIGPGVNGQPPPDVDFGTADTRAFFQDVRNGACRRFSTVLGPGSDGAHENHLHLDLARRMNRNGQVHTVCR